MSAALLALIPTHHRFDLLEQAMDSLGELPVLIVDDSPSGDLPAALGARAQIVIRSRGQEGFARAVNQGLRHAEELGYGWVLLLNDDAIMEPGAVEAMCSARTEASGVLAPVLVHPDGREQAGVFVRSWGRVNGRRSRGTPGDPDAVSGACMMIRSSERFDPGFPHGMEDFELCRRIRARGDRIQVVEAARCLHRGGASLSPRSREGQRHGQCGQQGGRQTGRWAPLTVLHVLHTRHIPCRDVPTAAVCPHWT